MTSAERPRLDGRVLKLLPFFLLAFLGLSLYRLSGEPSSPPAPDGASTELHGATMGTTYSVKLADPGAAAQRRSLQRRVQDALAAVDGAMSTYRKDSELSRFNRTAGTDQPFAISAALRDVMAVALSVGTQSRGALDVTVGPLVDAWGFGPDHPEERPDPQRLASLREHVGLSKLRLSARGLSRSDGQLRCDLSAVAKGYAVDRVAAALDQAGMRNYLVEVGGELRARGRRRDGQPFQVGIERPQPGSRAIERVIPLVDRAMATSGDYRNYFLEGRRRRSHLIDPRSGAPVTHDLRSVTVVDAECARADAWATALLVLGPEAGPRLAEARGLSALFIVHHDGEEPRSIVTPAFAALAPAPRNHP